MGKFRRLSIEERKEIESSLKKGISASQIAKNMGRTKNVVVVEIRRAGGKDSYNAEKAQIESDARNVRKITSGSKINRGDAHKEDVLRLFHEGKSFWQIRTKLGINREMLFRIYKELDIKNPTIAQLYERMEAKVNSLEKIVVELLEKVGKKG
jgi:IS30 family transposase